MSSFLVTRDRGAEPIVRDDGGADRRVRAQRSAGGIRDERTRSRRRATQGRTQDGVHPVADRAHSQLQEQRRVGHRSTDIGRQHVSSDSFHRAIIVGVVITGNVILS